MPRFLKNIKVDFISLVKKGANQKTVLLKSKDASTPVFDKVIDIKKNVEGVVYGIVYSPGQVDAQGDCSDAAEIKKAAYAFMKTLNLHNIDKNHDFNQVPAFVAENWILRKGDPVFPDEPEGSWAVGIKLEDENLIKEVQKGEITGISMAGAAEISQQQSSSDGSSLVKSLTKAIRDAFKKEDKKEDIDVSDFESALKEGFSEMKKSVDEAREEWKGLSGRIEAIEDKLKKSGQDMDVSDKSDIEGIM